MENNQNNNETKYNKRLSEGQKRVSKDYKNWSL